MSDEAKRQDEINWDEIAARNFRQLKWAAVACLAVSIPIGFLWGCWIAIAFLMVALALIAQCWAAEAHEAADHSD